MLGRTTDAEHRAEPGRASEVAGGGIRLRRMAAGLTIAASGAIIFAGYVLTPYGKGSAEIAELRTVAAHPMQTQVAAVVLHFGYLLLVPTAFALVHLARRGARRLSYTGLVFSVLGAGLSGLLAASARDRVQRAVDRLLFGYRKDPYAVVTRVGRRIDDAVGPLDALRQLTVELRSALRLPSAAVIPDDPRLAPVQAGHPAAGTVDIRVAVQGQQVATLRVGRRHHGERFRPDEQSALTDVGRRVGSLVQTAVLITDLQRSRETLVTAREEERRRLRQDLHDGVGPELAGLALQLDSLAGRLGSEAELADRARELRDRMRRTVAEVRRVVDDLRPPARARHPISDQLSRPASGGTVFHQDSESRPTKCSPAGGYPPRVCRMADSLALIRPLQGPPRSP